jgi:glycosyltransferase involved in cell wall biosynthesis
MNDDLIGGGTALGESAQPEPRRDTGDPSSKLGDIAAEAGLQRIEIVAWRDVDHPEAGGSEIHAARIAERWAAAGIDVVLVASRAPGAARAAARDGYHVSRPAGRYSVFPYVGASALARRGRRPDGTVEVWNGMPFFSPVWARHPRAVFLHHVHDGMWDLVLPAPLATAGKLIERRLAPVLYRHTPVVTLSESSRQGILRLLNLDPSQVTVVQPGVDERFTPGGKRDSDPLLVAVGRLVPYKRFDLLIEILARIKVRHPNLQAVIAGEGSERAALERLIAAHKAQDWLRLPGRIDDEALLALYRRAWALLSTSAYEGWGLTISEAAACGTPAIVSPIAGHIDAVQNGESGILAEPGPEMEAAVNTVLSDRMVSGRLDRGAVRRARQLTWDRTALDTLKVLAADAARR